MLHVSQIALIAGPRAYSIPYAGDYNGTTSEMHWTPGVAPTDGKKGTIAFWFNRDTIGSTQNIGFSYRGSGGNTWDLKFNADNTFTFFFNGLTSDGSLTTTSTYTDTTNWHQMTLGWDTTVPALYIEVDGAVPTLASNTPPTLNDAASWGANGKKIEIGTYSNASAQFFDGPLAEFHYIDGQRLGSSSFYSAGNPVEYTGSYGTNGVYHDYAASGDMGNDASGNNNDFIATNVTQIAY